VIDAKLGSIERANQLGGLLREIETILAKCGCPPKAKVTRSNRVRCAGRVPRMCRDHTPAYDWANLRVES